MTVVCDREIPSNSVVYHTRLLRGHLKTVPCSSAHLALLVVDGFAGQQQAVQSFASSRPGSMLDTRQFQPGSRKLHGAGRHAFASKDSSSDLNLSGQLVQLAHLLFHVKPGNRDQTFAETCKSFRQPSDCSSFIMRDTLRAWPSPSHSCGP